MYMQKIEEKYKEEIQVLLIKNDLLISSKSDRKKFKRQTKFSNKDNCNIFSLSLPPFFLGKKRLFMRKNANASFYGGVGAKM